MDEPNETAPQGLRIEKVTDMESLLSDKAKAVLGNVTEDATNMVSFKLIYSQSILATNAAYAENNKDSLEKDLSLFEQDLAKVFNKLVEDGMIGDRVLIPFSKMKMAVLDLSLRTMYFCLVASEHKPEVLNQYVKDTYGSKYDYFLNSYSPVGDSHTLECWAGPDTLNF